MRQRSQSGSNADLYPWLDYARAPKSPRRSFAVGFIIQALTIPAAIAALVMFEWFAFTADFDFLHRVALIFGAPCTVAMCVFYSWTTARRLMQPDAFAVLARDRRPPVVFLRSFHEDERRGSALAMDHTKTNYLDIREGVEIQIASAFERVGPFVAIGKPGEKLASLGAARLYVADEHWQAVVTSLLERAAAVVLQPGATPGTAWEVNVVAAHFDLHRVLLLTPDPTKRPLGYEKVRAMTAKVFPHPLPEDPGSCYGFTFDSALNPQPLREREDATLNAFFQRIAPTGAKRS